MHWIELLFPIALALYSVSIWASKLKHALLSWMLWTFGAGLLADASGTIFLCVVSAKQWSFTLHTVSGLVSLVLMAGHFFWALVIAGVRSSDRSREIFNRCSVWTWSIWIVAFLSGLIRTH